MSQAASGLVLTTPAMELLMRQKIKRFGRTLKACFLLKSFCFLLILYFFFWSLRLDPSLPDYSNHIQIIKSNKSASHVKLNVPVVKRRNLALVYFLFKETKPKQRREKYDKLEWKAISRCRDVEPWCTLFAYSSRCLIKCRMNGMCCVFPEFLWACHKFPSNKVSSGFYV